MNADAQVWAALERQPGFAEGMERAREDYEAGRFEPFEHRWMDERWTEIIRLVSDGLTYRCPERGRHCGGYTDHGNEAHDIVRSAIAALASPADREG